MQKKSSIVLMRDVKEAIAIASMNQAGVTEARVKTAWRKVFL
jgi:hypothetical protein